jgi:3-methyladenine DNA glycosylase AlkD
LWASGVHEARILATIVTNRRVTRRQMDRWALDFDSWDVCDQACQNLFRYTPLAWAAATEWAGAQREFVRRAAFALMAGLAVKAKDAPDEDFEALLPLISGAATDQRNLVKKAVNWALRAIGKRNLRLRCAAIAAAENIRLTTPAHADRQRAARTRALSSRRHPSVNDPMVVVRGSSCRRPPPQALTVQFQHVQCGSRHAQRTLGICHRISALGNINQQRVALYFEDFAGHGTAIIQGDRNVFAYQLGEFCPGQPLGRIRGRGWGKPRENRRHCKRLKT